MQVIDLPLEHPFRLRAIDPAQLHTIWPQVRAGLEAVKAKHNPDWIPEDIYTSLKANAATLLVADEADGFLILQRQQRFYGPCVLVWVCYAPGEMAQLASWNASPARWARRGLRCTDARAGSAIHSGPRARRSTYTR